MAAMQRRCSCTQPASKHRPVCGKRVRRAHVIHAHARLAAARHLGLADLPAAHVSASRLCGITGRPPSVG
ncbi:hypothetical protein FHR48_002433 [Xanthomonas arboricola]|nr:hypothetical protein [Xanthomonas cannabis]